MAVSLATALLLAALFAGDSVWTAVAALLLAGGWSALALTGRAPIPGGGAVLLGLLLATAAWAGLSIAWSVTPDRRGRSSTARSCSPHSWSWGSCSARPAHARAAGRRRPSSWRSAPRWSGLSPGRRSRRSTRTAAGRRGCVTRSATGTRSPWRPTCCSCSRSGSALDAGRSRAIRVAGAVLAYAAVRRRPADGVAGRRRGRRARRRAARLAAQGPCRDRVARPRRRSARGRGRRVGVHARGARRGRPAPLGPGRGRSDLRAPAARRRRPRRLGGRLARGAEPSRSSVRRTLSIAVAAVAIVGAGALVFSAGRIEGAFCGDEVDQRSRSARQPQLEQPLLLVGRGVGHLPRRSAHRCGSRELRGGAQALPRARVGRDRAAQRSAPVPGRDGCRRARPAGGARRCRRRGRGGRAAPARRP